MDKSLAFSIFALVAFATTPAGAQQVTGELGSPTATTTITENNSRRRRRLRWGDQGESLRVDALVAAARRTAEGRAQRAADHDG